MSTEITVLTKEDVCANPSIIGENLAQLALAIEDTKDNLSDIQNRGFWKRLVNNNVRDLAEAMLKQNETISFFVLIVQQIASLSMNNLIVLGGIMDGLNKVEAINGIRDNKYIGMARDYLTEALKSAQRSSDNEKEIENLKIKLNEYYGKQESQGKYIFEQSMRISELEKGIADQNKLIQKLESAIVCQKKSSIIGYVVGTGVVSVVLAVIFIFFK